jgi:ribonuclease HII
MNRNKLFSRFFAACEQGEERGTPALWWRGAGSEAEEMRKLLKEEEERITELQAPERDLFAMGISSCAGVDEAGRGPLAGPVVAAAASFTRLPRFPFINDSKKLSHQERMTLFSWLGKFCHLSIGMATHEEIDALNIHRASLLAMARAVEGLPEKPSYILVDGRFTIPGISIPQRAIIKGDSRAFSIASASIAAKVTRDTIMEEYHSRYPQYGFALHRGYPTRDHCIALKTHGLCAIHRKSYGPVRACLAEENPIEH